MKIIRLLIKFILFSDVTTRKRWSPHSLKALESAFSSNILNKSLPSLPEIRMAKLMYPALKLRGTPVIKTAIHNRVRKLLGTNNKTKRNIF